MVVTHELGHHFGLSHNHFEGKNGTIYKGSEKTNYLQGSHYHLMESFLGQQNKPYDSVFDTPMDTGDSGMAFYISSKPTVEGMTKFYPNWSASMGELGQNLLLGKAPIKNTLTRSGQEEPVGASLQMTYAGYITRTFFSRDQGRIMRNFLAIIFLYHM